MPLFDAPKAFIEDLRRYDPALRCRWSDGRRSFLIERKVSRGRAFPPSEFGDPDEYRAASDGYMILMDVERECLDNRVFFTLWQSDIWRQGGADAVNDRIDRVQAEIFRESRVAFNDRNRQEAKAAFRYMNCVRTVPENAAHTAPPGGMSIID